LSIKETAFSYFQQGLNVVLVQTKKPLIEWKPLQTTRQTKEDFNGLPWKEADGFALIGGSLNLKGQFLGCIDFDVKSQSSEAKVKGLAALRYVRITQLEQTPSGGQHWVYFSEVKPKSISNYLGLCALELLGNSKLVIMAPSKGYVRLNDNTPTVVTDVEAMFFEALFKVGVRAERRRDFDNTRKLSNSITKFKPLKNSEEERIIGFLCRYWMVGYRNRVTMCFLGWAVKKGISQDTAYRIISEVTSRMADEERDARLAQVGYHYHKVDNAAGFIGKTGLKEIIRMVNSLKV
jgi:hypothetical protein